MAFTLAQARSKLFSFVTYTLSGQEALVTDRINSALERIFNSGKWKGMLTTVVFGNSIDPNQWWSDTAVPYITLPRQFQSVLGVRFGASARQIFPRWQEFMAGGPGQLTAGSSMQMLVDMGDDFVTYSDPLLPFYPRFEITDTDDDGKVILFKALDTTGRPVFDSVGNAWLSITLSVAGAFYSGVIGKITEIHKPLTQGTVNLLAMSVADTTLKAQIGSYEPTETVPSYKRYKAVAGQFSSTVTCLCKRRFVSLVNVADDETLITPSNEGALKLTLMALQYEDKNDLERAETYFQKAIYLLNAELKEDMGDPVITLQMNPLAAAMNIPNRY